MKVIVIDDGINNLFFDIGLLYLDLVVTDELGISYQKVKKEGLSHGTNCAGIIRKYAPTAEIGSIKVISEKTGKGTIDKLLVALEFCLNYDIDIINLSLGSSQFQDFSSLSKIVSRLYREGKIIVSAFNNNGSYTIPASLEGVIGVKSNQSLKNDEFLLQNKNHINWVEASGTHILIKGNRLNYKTKLCNSYATPVITSIIHNLIENMESVDIDYIYSSFNYNKLNKSLLNPNLIDEAFVIDYTESEELIENVFFDISGYYDRRNFYHKFKITDKAYVIVIAENKKDISKILLKIREQIEFVRGIFICTKNEFHIPLSFRNKIWFENNYFKSWSRQNRSEEVGGGNSPLVIIGGAKKSLIIILQEIKSLFYNEDYFIKVIGDFNRSYLYGFEQYVSVNGCLDFITQIFMKFECDLCVLGTENIENIKEVGDIIFILNENEDKINFIKEKNSVSINFDARLYKKYAKDIFEKILLFYN